MDHLSPAAKRTIAAAFLNLIRIETGYHLRRGAMRDAMRTLVRVRPVTLALGVPVLIRRLGRRIFRRLRPLDLPDAFDSSRWDG
jgi:hypothetical protein